MVSIIKKHFEISGRDDAYSSERSQMKKVLVSRDKIVSACFQSAGQNIVVIFVPTCPFRSLRRMHVVLGRLGDQGQRIILFLFCR